MRLTPPRRARRRMAGLVMPAAWFTEEDQDCRSCGLPLTDNKLNDVCTSKQSACCWCVPSRTAQEPDSCLAQSRGRTGTTLHDGPCTRQHSNSPWMLSRRTLRWRLAPPLPRPLPPLPRPDMAASWYVGVWVGAGRMLDRIALLFAGAMPQNPVLSKRLAKLDINTCACSLITT